MTKCEVCEKNSLMPESLGESKICKMCFMKINGPLWKYRTYEKYGDVEQQRKRTIQKAESQGFPPAVIEGIDMFFTQEQKGMCSCCVCNEVVRTLEVIGEAKLCKRCFSKINIEAWKEDDYDDNEEVEENRKEVLKIAKKKNYPSVVIEGINAHFDKYIDKELIQSISGRGQILKLYESKIILETYASFSPEDLASDYAKMKSKAESGNRFADGAGAVVRGFLTGGVVKAGVSLVTNVAAGTVVNQVSSRGELQAVSKGKKEIPYENCADVELIAPGETELACIKLYAKGSKSEFIFLFGNYSSNVNKASKACSYIVSRIHEASVSKKMRIAESAPGSIVNKVSAADEILKYKNLLDVGAITPEEFDLKKKQLLEL